MRRARPSRKTENPIIIAGKRPNTGLSGRFGGKGFNFPLPMLKKFLLPLLLCLSAHFPAAAPLKPSRPVAAPLSAHAAALDTARVRKLYQDGEFDQAIGIL